MDNIGCSGDWNGSKGSDRLGKYRTVSDRQERRENEWSAGDFKGTAAKACMRRDWGSSDRQERKINKDNESGEV